MFNSTKQVSIELTNICNEDCTFCTTQFITRPKGSMDLELAKRVIKEVKDKNFCHYVSTNVMGDPFIYKHIYEVIEYANSIGQNLEIITNGERLDDERAEKLLSYNPWSIGFSLHASDPESFKFKKSRLDYHEYKRRFFNLIETKFRIKSTSSITVNVLSTLFYQHDKFQILDTEDKVNDFCDELSEFAAKMKKKYNLNFPVPKKFNFGTTMILPGITVIVHSTYHTWSNEILPEGKKVVPKTGYCSTPFEQLNVLWNGDTVLCCIDYDGELKYDNIKDKSILEVYNGPELTRLRGEFLKQGDIPSKCQKCLGTVVNEDGSEFRFIGQDLDKNYIDKSRRMFHRFVRGFYNNELWNLLSSRFQNKSYFHQKTLDQYESQNENNKKEVIAEDKKAS